MPEYVDGFVIAVPAANVDAYRKIARKACKIWMEFGALDYRECVSDDLAVKCGTPFTKLAKTKPDEVVIFSWIVYKSKAHRDKVNAKVLSDERIQEMCGDGMPFDPKRMSYGGFKSVVHAAAESHG